ncbi:hypothetical protein FKM82_020566 [Ascaphus truei]
MPIGWPHSEATPKILIGTRRYAACQIGTVGGSVRGGGAPGGTVGKKGPRVPDRGRSPLENKFKMCTMWPQCHGDPGAPGIGAAAATSCDTQRVKAAPPAPHPRERCSGSLRLSHERHLQRRGTAPPHRSISASPRVTDTAEEPEVEEEGGQYPEEEEERGQVQGEETQGNEFFHASLIPPSPLGRSK